MCFECFLNGDHRGHKFEIKQSGGGVCDCGDPDGLKPEGYCKNHHGHAHLDPSISKTSIEAFQKSFMNLCTAILYYSTLKPGTNISSSKHKDILCAWELFWEYLEEGFNCNQNIIILSFETLTDEELLKKYFPEKKLLELIDCLDLKINKNSTEILPNLLKIFKDDKTGKSICYDVT
jgi:hypothetical protein